MSGPTLTWWSWLCAVSALNVLAWLATAAALRRRSAGLHPLGWAPVRLQMALSAVYVLGCAYRSVFPVFDLRRLCLVDSWLSSVIVGRSVATLAELCFAAQWALLLKAVAQAGGCRSTTHIARCIVPLIVVAELCSWTAVLTTSNLGHVLEESLWGLAALLLLAGLVRVWPRCRPEMRPLLATAGVLTLAYAVYMFRVDVPMYWARWLLDTASGHRPLAIAQGLVDASVRWVVSHRWADWKTEIVWMSLYFSVGVWLSIGLVHVHGFLSARTVPPPVRLGRRPAEQAAAHAPSFPA